MQEYVNVCMHAVWCMIACIRMYAGIRMYAVWCMNASIGVCMQCGV